MRVPVRHGHRVISSNAFLQILVLGNALFSMIIFVAIAWAYYSDKTVLGELSAVERAWYAAILAFWMIAEPPRLLMGYRGNFTHSGAFIFGFLVLTAMSHGGIMALYTVGIPWRSSLDVGLGSVQLVFAILEFGVGMHYMSWLITRNTIEFYVGLKGND